jgi:hypothetical protein
MRMEAPNTCTLWVTYIYYIKADLGAAWAGQVRPNGKPALSQMFSVANEANLGEEPPKGSENSSL